MDKKAFDQLKENTLNSLAKQATAEELLESDLLRRALLGAAGTGLGGLGGYGLGALTGLPKGYSALGGAGLGLGGALLSDPYLMALLTQDKPTPPDSTALNEARERPSETSSETFGRELQKSVKKQDQKYQ